MFNCFLVKIGKGSEFGNNFIGHTNHSCIGYELDRVVGLDPCPEEIVSSRSRVSSR